VPQEYLPLAVASIFSAGFAALVTLLARTLGPKRPTPSKLKPYECGIEPIFPLRRRFSVKFYVVAMLLIVFDTELAFLFPWAASVQQAGTVGYVEMLLFALLLLVGFFWMWRRGVFEWE
jgi:NADH-quinone oxidoreductase subunit A